MNETPGEHSNNPETLGELLHLFNLQKLNDVRKYCKSLRIAKADMASLCLCGQVSGGLPPYAYACHFTEIRPPHLDLSDADLDAISRNGVGKLSKDAQTAVNKLFQLDIERKLIAVHLFYEPSQRFWHLFYFNQRDLSNRENHWDAGSHIHYSRESLVNVDLHTVWNNILKPDPKFPKSLHIRYRGHYDD